MSLLLAEDDPPLSQDDFVMLARVDFGAFVVLLFPELHDGKEMIFAPYVDVMVEALMRTTSGGRQRIIFNLPPGYMKSLLVSVLYTAWRMGVNPSERIICISYGDDLTHNLSRQTRRVLQSRLYNLIFPDTQLDKKAEDSLTTTKGGQRFATSVGSQIAGFRADLIVIDDPMQPDEAFSESAKQKLRDWYYGVVVQRLLAGGVIVLVMHRLAPDDLTATFVEEGGWLHIALPLIEVKGTEYSDKRKRVVMHRQPGDLLNAAWSSREDVERIQNSIPGDIFEAQYQQDPRFGGSGICSTDRLARYGEAPRFEVIIHSWDLAATKGGGDWTVCVKFGLARDKEGRDILYLIGFIRVRVELPDVRELIIAQDNADKPALIIMDGVGIGLGVYQDLLRLGMKNILASGTMQRENVEGLKVLRFHTALLPLYDGLVCIPNTMPGLEVLLAEFATFPDGKNDDLVDAIGNVAANRELVVREARRRGERMGRQWLPPASAQEPPVPLSRDQELFNRRQRRFYD